MRDLNELGDELQDTIPHFEVKLCNYVRSGAGKHCILLPRCYLEYRNSWKGRYEVRNQEMDQKSMRRESFMGWRQLSLRAKIATFVITVSILQLSFVGAYGYWTSQRAIDAAVRGIAHNRVTEIEANIQKYLRESKLTMLAIASSPAWRSDYTDPERRGEWQAEQQRVINYVDRTTASGIDEFCFIGANGAERTRLVDGKLEFDLSTNEKDNVFFTPSMKIPNDEVYHSLPYMSGDTDRWVIAVTTPVYDEGGKQVAFIHLERPVQQLLDVIKGSLKGAGETAYVFDGNNAPILSTNSEVDNDRNTLEADVPATVTKLIGVEVADAKSGTEEMKQSRGEENGDDYGTPAAGAQAPDYEGGALGGEVMTFKSSGKSYFLSSGKQEFLDHTANSWLIAVSVPQSSASEFRAAFTFLPILLAGILFLVAVAAVAVARNMAKPLESLVGGAEKVAQGDLNVTIEGNQGPDFDRVGSAFNEMVKKIKSMIDTEQESRGRVESSVAQFKSFIEQVRSGDMTTRLPEDQEDTELSVIAGRLNELLDALSRMVGDTQKAAAEIAAASHQILALTAQHNSGAAAQAASISQASATVDEIRQTAEETANRAQTVADSATLSVDTAQAGLQAVEQTVSGMGRVKDTVGSIANNIFTLMEHTQQIDNIITSVNDLAEQSNLLALNASIEAARAGEQGKGFAVVAAEVRNLAEQSQHATAQVKGILSDIQDATKAVTLVTEEGAKAVDANMELAEKAGTTIRLISETISDSADTAGQILAATEQQAEGMDQMVEVMGNIDESTAQALSSTKQIEQAVEGLSKLGQDLQKQISRYKT